MKYNKEAFVADMGIGSEMAADLFGEKKKLDLDFEEELKKRGGTLVTELEIDRLKFNPNNHFHAIEGEAWEEFKGSIAEVGILTPLIVRAKEDRYEIIAGHNRCNAAREIGLRTVPAIIIEADDVQASVLMAVTNRQRENTTELEWGWAYRNTYEALKKPSGERTDLTSGQRDQRSDSTSGQRGQRSEKGKWTVDIVAEKYGVGVKTIQRKMRLTYLTKPAYFQYEKKRITQEIAVEISYLDEIPQDIVANYIESGGIVSVEQIKKLRETLAAEENQSRAPIDVIQEVIALDDIGMEKKQKKMVINEKLVDKYLPEYIKVKAPEQKNDFLKSAVAHFAEYLEAHPDEMEQFR